MKNKELLIVILFVTLLNFFMNYNFIYYCY